MKLLPVQVALGFLVADLGAGQRAGPDRVAAVAPGSPGADAGVEHGDLLTRLDGQPVISSAGLALLLGDLAGRAAVVATVVRGDDESSLEIRLPAPP